MRISDWNSDVCPSDLAGRTVRRPDLTLAVADHNLPTTPRVDARGARLPIADPGSAEQLAALEANVAQFGVPYIEATAEAQGIVHVVGPEQGFTLPGTTLVCGDSHTDRKSTRLNSSH